MARGRASNKATRPMINRSEDAGWARRIGWVCFISFVALMPLVIGALPPSWGPLASIRAADPFGLPKQVTFLVLAGVSFAALCVSLMRGESGLYWHPVMWILVAVVGWAGVSTIFAPSPALATWGAYNRNDGLVALFGYGLAAFLAIQFVRSRRALRVVMITAVASGCIVSLYAVSQYAGFDPIGWIGETARVFSLFGNADHLGNYLVFPLALAVGLALTTPERGWSLALWGATALITAALVATLTRGAWIAALVMIGSVVYVAQYQRWRASRWQKIGSWALIAAFIVAAVVAIVLIRPRQSGSATSFYQLLERLSNGRTVIWLTGIRAWLTRPILGWGPDSFQPAFDSAVGPNWYAIVSGLQGADNAHSFLVQRLVTLGIPGFVLSVWAIVQTGIQSFRRTVTIDDSAGHLLFASVWGAFIGLTTALLLGVSVPAVSVWLWLTVGLLLAPMAHRVSAPPKAALALASAVGVALALWAGSWLVADVMIAQAMGLQPGPAQVSEVEAAARLNPLAQAYRWRVAEAILNEAVAQQNAGDSRAAVDQTMLRAIAAYDAAARADRGDALVRVAYAHVLITYASQNPGGDAAQRAVEVAQAAARLAPRQAAVLVILAQAYQASGRIADAEKTARLARSIAPSYAGEALGSLGLTGTPAP